MMIVLIALMVLWIGLISVYFFTRESGPPSALRVGTDEPSAIATADRSTESNTSQGKSSRATPTGEDSGIVSVAQTGQPPGSSEIESAGSEQAKTEPDKTTAINDAPQSTGTEKKEALITLEMINETYGVAPEVYFGFNSNSLDDQSYGILHMVAKYCVQNPGAKLILKGYSDSSGVRSYNIKLSEFRANMVKTYLVGRGVAPLAVKTLAMGPEAQGSETAQRKVVIEIVAPE
ncbi:OmpA family protein [Desulfosarcina ovata]|nr:OmpA family protein [Desulfosarcina ovata]